MFNKNPFMGKRKKQKDKEDTVKLVVRIEADLRDAFIETCQSMDTTASREVRRFIRKFLARSGSTDARGPAHDHDGSAGPPPDT